MESGITSIPAYGDPSPPYTTVEGSEQAIKPTGVPRRSVYTTLRHWLPLWFQTMYVPNMQRLEVWWEHEIRHAYGGFDSLGATVDL